MNATKKIVETCEQLWAEDLVERPVRLIAGEPNIVCYVVSSMGTLADDCGAEGDPYWPDDTEHWGYVTVRAFVGGDREHDGHFAGEPINVSLAEIQPLCLDCCGLLYESDVESPGSCYNPDCFMRCAEA